MTYRIVIADDHPLVRSGLRAVLAEENDLQLVGEAENGEQALALCEQLRPDVLLLDLSMHETQPDELVAELRQRCPKTKVLVLSGDLSAQQLPGLLASGIVGYVLKDEGAEVVCQAIRSVVQDGTWFSGTVVSRLRQGLRGETLDIDPAALTDRDKQLLACFVRGLSNEQISVELNLTPQTIRNYSSQLYRKLAVSSREQAIVWALKHGFGRSDRE